VFSKCSWPRRTILFHANETTTNSMYTLHATDTEDTHTDKEKRATNNGGGGQCN
jgi:hypothetical protein